MFFRSKGYTEEEIKDYKLWREITIKASLAGFNPFKDISDLTIIAAEKNKKLDVKNEIMKTSIKHKWMENILCHGQP